MKTIRTEWGEMPLNDWREIKLKHAEWCARSSVVWWRVWMSTAALFGISGVSVAIFATVQIIRGDIRATVLLLIPMILWKATQIAVLNARAVCEIFLHKRQEIVDEVASEMRRHG